MPISKRLESRGKHAQFFDRDSKERWRRRFPQSLKAGNGHVIDLLLSEELKDQLEAIKKITLLLTNATDGHDFDRAPLITCLVEMHCLCSPRHVLQRNIARCLESARGVHQDTVHLAIRDCLLKLLNSSVDGQRRCVQYIQSLMEHYKSGEEVLVELLPRVIDCLVSYLEVGYKELHHRNCQDHELFVSTTKVFLNVLHHCSTAVLHSMSEPETDTTVETHSNDLCSIVWPDSSDSIGHTHWMRQRLQRVVTICDKILKDESYLPRDLILSLSMVYVVTMVTMHPHDVPSAIQSLFDDWLLDCPSVSNGDGFLFSRLSICHALIAKLSHLHLASVVVGNDKVVLFALFPILCDLLDHFTETSHRFNAAKALAMWTALLRPCLDLPTVSSQREQVSPNSTIVTTLLRYVWSLWEDPIEGIRHQCRSIFEGLISLYQSGQDEQEHLLSLSRPLLSLSSPTRGKYSLLASLVPHISVIQVLREWPHLPNELMDTMGLQVLACRAGELWSQMVKKYYQESEQEVDQWKEVWFPPLVSRLLTGLPLARQHVKQYCLASLFTTAPNAMLIMNDVIKKKSCDLSCDSTNILMTQLACIQCAFINGCGLPNDDNMVVLENAIYHCDEQIVVSALQLLCESRCLTDLVPLPHLPLIHSCLVTHMNSQSPSFRSQAICIFKKLLTRICDSSHCRLHSEAKKKKRSEKLQEQLVAAAEEEEDNASAIDKDIKKYKDFLVLMSESCLQTLHPLSNFQRRNMALSLLDVMSTVLDPSQLPVTVKEQYGINAILPDPSLMGLVYVLYDTFDDNRVLALQLLDKLCKFDRCELPPLQPLLLDYHRLITSPKSTDCASGYRMTKFLLRHHPQATAEWLSVKTNTLPQGGGIVAKGEWSMLVMRSLFSILKDHVTQAGRSLVNASITNPMHGVLQSIRSIWEEINVSAFSPLALQELVVLMNIAVDLCVSVGKMVAPVVCNSSPEGFMLPTNSSEDGDGLQLEENQVNNSNHSNSCHGNAQSLLVCCWRSMKEAIQLLSVIIETAQENSCIDFVKEEVISDLLLQQLTKAYHRGAFEIAHVGFVKLCRYLWTRPGTSAHTCMPVAWVNELLGSLQSSSMAQLLSITRRSAGLPFYVQAILTTEPPSNGQKCLKHVMSTLLNIASSSMSSHSMIQAKEAHENSLNDPQKQFELVPEPSSVHALNILRGLYRDNKLGEHVTPYITEGLQTAIRGFSACYWPVRNSCTLLFSTLIMRVFGVKKVQDERSLENKLTSREFFSRFPSLHSFLLETLKESDEQLFPVLLLLSRLYPSPLDDTHSPLSMTPFRPYIIKAAGSSIWKCRILASEAFLPTLSSSDLPDVFSLLLEQLSSKDQNKSHGVLLMLLSILRHSSPTCTDGETVLTITGDLLSVLFSKLMSKSYFGSSLNACHITRELFMDLVCTLLPHIDSAQSSTSMNELISNAREDLITGRLKGKPLVNELPSKLMSFLMVIVENVPACGVNVLNANSILVLSWQHHSELSLFTELVLKHAKDLSDGDKEQLLKLALSKANNECTEGYEVVTGLIKFGYNVETEIVGLFEKTIKRLCEGYLREDLMIEMIRFISACLSFLTVVKEELLADLLSFMSSRCTETYSDSVRRCIASFLGINWNVLVYLRSSISTFWPMVFTLLQDVQEEVRGEMCSSLDGKISGKEFKSSLCQQSVLREVVFCIPKVYQSEPEEAVKVLLCVSNRFDDDHDVTNDTQDRVSSLLFEEDKSNSYAEPLQLLEYVGQALLSIDTLVDSHTVSVDGLCDSFKYIAMSDLFVNEKDSINLWQLKPNEVVKLFKKRYFK